MEKAVRTQPMKSDPKTQRPTKRNHPEMIEGGESKISKTSSSKDLPAVTQVKKSDVQKSERKPIEPQDSGHYELSPLMSKALESELNNLMEKVYQSLADKDTARKDILDMYWNYMKDTLKNTIGLTVTKRLLPVNNSLYIKIVFNSKPVKEDLAVFLKKYNLAAFKRIGNHGGMFIAKMKSFQTFDDVCTCKVLKCGKTIVTATPCYKFTYCPPNLRTIYDGKKPKPDANTSKNTVELKSDVKQTKAEENKEKINKASNESNKPVEANASVKPTSQNTTPAKTTQNNAPAKTTQTPTPVKTTQNQKSTAAKSISQNTAAAKTIENISVAKPTTQTATVSKPATQTATPAKPTTAKSTTQTATPAKTSTETAAKPITETTTPVKPTTQTATPTKTTTQTATPAKTTTQTTTPAKTTAQTTPAVKQNAAKSTTQTATTAAKPTTENTPAKPAQNTTAKINTEKTPVSKTTQNTTPKPTQNSTVAKTTSKPSVLATVSKNVPKAKTIPAKPQVSKPNGDKKLKDTKPTSNKMKIKIPVKPAKPAKKESDFDELDDHDILALLSGGIVLDECSGSEEDY